MASHGAQEIIASHHQQDRRFLGRDRGGPGHVPDEGDLAKAIGRLVECPQHDPALLDAEAPVFHDVVGVPALTFGDDGRAGIDGQPAHASRQGLQVRCWKGCERTDTNQQRQFAGRDAGATVDVPKPAPAEQDGQRQECTGDRQRALDADDRDHDRRKQRTEGDADQVDALERSQDTAQDDIRGRPLEDGQAGHSTCRIADAAEGDEQRSIEAGPEQGGGDQCTAQDARGQRESWCQPAPSDEQERDGASQDRPDAQGPVQDAGTGRAGVEDLQREKHEQDIHRAARDGPKAQDPDDQPDVSVPADHPQPLQNAPSGDARRSVGSLADIHLWYRDLAVEEHPSRHRQHEHGRDADSDRRGREDVAWPADGQDRRRSERTQEGATALHRPGQAVGGTQLLRRPRDLRQ